MSTKPKIARPDPWGFLQRFTAARIALGRAGGSVPTSALLDFQWAHARARDAVHDELDVEALCGELSRQGLPTIRLHSAATSRREFIARPDLGRILNQPSVAALESQVSQSAAADVVFVIADGLSAMAARRHAQPLLLSLIPALRQAKWQLAPLCVVCQGRVAIGDEIGALLNARQVVMLIGERPGLSSPDSLGLYLTQDPRPGRSNAERNCISNVRPEGLPYELAAHKLFHLMAQARRRGLSGVELKENAATLEADEMAKGKGYLDQRTET